MSRITEDGGFGNWGDPGRGIVDEPLQPRVQSMVLLDHALHLIGKALRACIASGYADGERANRQQHNRCAPAFVGRPRKICYLQHLRKAIVSIMKRLRATLSLLARVTEVWIR